MREIAKQAQIYICKTDGGIQIFIGNIEDLSQHIQSSIYFKEHPTTKHYQGIREERDWLFPQVDGYFPSFFGYWKKCERYLK
jgi:deoxyribodipyrimidine photo-lyase